MLRPARHRRRSAILLVLAAKFACSDVFGQARKIGLLLVFDGSVAILSATVMRGPD
jgi:hypothetical protein